MIAALVLLVAHQALGQLEQVAQFSDRVQLRVPGNLLGDGEVRALSRWPGLVELELSLPLTKVQAAQLRKLGRLAVRVPRQDASLKLLGPALVRTEIAPPQPAGPGELARTSEPVCSGTLRDDLLELRAIDACAVRWLSERLGPHPEAPEPPPRPR